MLALEIETHVHECVDKVFHVLGGNRFDVDYGGCQYGIFSAACMVEALYALENGLIPDAIQVLFTAKMTPAQLGQLDQLAKNLSALDRQKDLCSGAEPLMPRLRWSDGISSLSDMLNTKWALCLLLWH